MPFFRLPEGTYETVKAGGGPLTVDAAEYDDASPPAPTGATLRVTVFLDGSTVRSAPEADAPAIMAALQQAQLEAQALRQKILTLIQSAAGKNVDPTAPNALTATERSAVNAAIWYKLGVIDKAGNLRPPGEWL